ncbi:hypothetical protein CPB86DRAFT_800875 [Serendipita vermifera]|nr:hypothetical protein CPB86DRAFT_800875 [Serendipita vermifera]
MSMTPPETEDVEAIFTASFELLFDHPQTCVTVTEGKLWTHQSSGIVLDIPQVVSAANWSLHADAIWNASIFLSEHLDILDERFEGDTLELGSGGGLLGSARSTPLFAIFLLTAYPNSKLVLTDYPDEGIISALKKNIALNRMDHSVSVLPLDWNDVSSLQGRTFDTVVAADTLWNSELHKPFCKAVYATLRQTGQAQAHLIAGLHTGRYTIQRFLERTKSEHLMITKLVEYHISGVGQREWAVERPDENSIERARWSTSSAG